MAGQSGLRPFPLGRGAIEQVRFDTLRELLVAGDLPVGGRLQARFAASATDALPGEAPAVEVTTSEGAATRVAGSCVYNSHTRTVRGAFRCVLPTGQRLACSFPPTPVGLPRPAP